MRLKSASLLALSLCCSWACSQQRLPYEDTSLPAQQRIDDLVSRMTLEEKVSQMINTSPAIPRLHVPAYDWWNEGLHGVARAGYATMFPQAIGMAATWDAPLLEQIGGVISTEARAKNNDALRHDNHSIYYGLTFWSPNINIFRDPRWGRGQETYGEDPFLTSRLGVSFVEGLQGTDARVFKVIATPKHFAVHSGPESTRHSANIDPTAHDLWDTYLPAFRATITEAHADSIMCAYNAVNGAPACASRQLLTDILRHDWKFQGFVTSDCGAIDDFFHANAHHTSAGRAAAAAEGIKAGTDTNCGNTYLALGDAVRQHLLTEAEIDTSLKRLFKARFDLGLFDAPGSNPYTSLPLSEVESPAHRELALKAARESIVLLKNDHGILPLKPASVHTIAVLGPNAASLSALEGNYNAIPRDPVLPVDAVAHAFAGAKVLYAQGAPYADGVMLPVPRTFFHPDASSPVQGLTGEYFASNNFESKPILTRVDREIDFDWNAVAPVPGSDAKAFAVRWSGTLQVPQPGDFEFALRLPHCYPCGDHEKFAVFYDGKQVSGQDLAVADYRRTSTPRFVLKIADTSRHTLRVEYLHSAPLFGAGISLEWTPQPEMLRSQAVAAAEKADLVLAFVGLSPELEGEEMPLKIMGFAGGDRTDIQLPAPQEQMLEAVKATGKPLIVVLLNGSALAVQWAQEHADAILEAWYPGQGGAQAIAETLVGSNNPGGRLPVTVYRSLDQLPAFENYSMANRTYRFFKGEPLYRFGFGLSYTSFAYSNVRLSTSALKAGATLMVQADVKNIGSTVGDEVAELYLTPPQTRVSAIRQLAGFQRLHLAPGETRHVSFALDPRTLSQVDEEGKRAVRPGTYGLSLGGSQPSRDTEAIKFSIAGTQELSH